jgi:hypothetical protein
METEWIEEMSDLTKHTTAQVVAALSKHHDWTAEAPKTDELTAVKCNGDGMHVLFEYQLCGEWTTDRAPDVRSDWTIERADGSIVERKPRRRRVMIGNAKTNGVNHRIQFEPDVHELLKPDFDYYIYAVVKQ